MAADDFQNDPAQGNPADPSSSSPYSGNRPASGARRATPGEVLTSGFQGAQNAGDFLGLDTEFTASQDPNQAYGQGSLDLVPPPGTYDPSVAEPAPLPDGDPVQEFAEAPSAFEFGEDLGSEEGEFAPLDSAPSNRKPALVAAVLVAALAGAGYYFWPTLSAKYLGKSSGEVARVEPTPKAAPAKGAPAPAGAASTAPGGETTAKAPDVPPKRTGDAPDTAKGQPTPTPTAPVRPTPTVAGKDEPRGAETRPPQGADVLEALLGKPAVPAGAEGAPSAEPQPTAFPDFAGSDYAWASEDQLELIWRGSEVPLEAVNAPAKTLMPRVGRVRVFMNTGDIFEGRLYAVGQKRVWIDAAPGRIGLDGERVERIEVLPPPPAGAQPAPEGADLLAGGKRVRVRVPGGMLYGKVLKIEGDEVILARDGGGRVRVQASDVEDLGSGRTIVVGR